MTAQTPVEVDAETGRCEGERTYGYQCTGQDVDGVHYCTVWLPNLDGPVVAGGLFWGAPLLDRAMAAVRLLHGFGRKKEAAA